MLPFLLLNYTLFFLEESCFPLLSLNMAGVGIGVGDIIMACNFIYTTCQRYKDAPDDFNEVAAKAKSTAVVLERLEVEAKAVGNLAERAGPQA